MTIISNYKALEEIFLNLKVSAFIGDKVTLTEFTADGYNAEGGGPVQSGNMFNYAR